MNTQKSVNQVLDYVCKMAGEAELPVRTSFELASSLQRFFGKLEQSNEQYDHGE